MRSSGLGILLLALVCVVAPGLGHAADECGDVNGDGGFSPVDALLILNASVGVEVDLACTTGADGCGDVNGDGNLSPVDALLVLNRSVGFDVEFNCAASSLPRNRVRYLNRLACHDKAFKSVLTLTAEGLEWESRSGQPSEYQDYDKDQLGGGWNVTLGACGSRHLSDLVDLPAGRLVRVELTLGLFNSIDLAFFNEAPIALTAGTEEPLAVISVPAPPGLSTAR